MAEREGNEKRREIRVHGRKKRRMNLNNAEKITEILRGAKRASQPTARHARISV